MFKQISLWLVPLLMCANQSYSQNNNLNAGLKKIKDLIIYNDSSYFAAFPSVIKKKNGELLVAFRNAPDRTTTFGEKGNSHVDPNSYLVGVTSKDGEKWSSPQLIYAHPFGGSQDPCLIQLKSGTIICASYGWGFGRSDARTAPNLFKTGHNATFLGGYIIRSTDNGKTWGPTIYPPHIQPEVNISLLGNPIPAYNRGAMYESNGKVYWSVAATSLNKEGKKVQTNHLLISEDEGQTWTYSAPIAVDDKVIFNEASVYVTPKGDILSFLRTAAFDDQACIARSTDGGKTFKWESMGFKGHPLQALRLPDNRVLIVYGYRHKPNGIRARILNAECTDYKESKEFILREDGANGDIGYPWAVMLDKKRILVTYYFNTASIKNRHIAATIVELTK